MPLGRPRRRLVNNIKMDLREISWCGLDLQINSLTREMCTVPRILCNVWKLQILIKFGMADHTFSKVLMD
jgi:hypothetical protein